MHLYQFSYPISKPYPFRWFTPVVVGGGLVLAVIFSFINFPANAYDMTTITTFDPEDIERDTRHTAFSPLGLFDGDGLKPYCQPHNLSVGDRFFTTNMGFMYEVEKIYQFDDKTQTGSLAQSAPYRNETLQSCRPTKITIDVLKSDTAKPPTWWISWGVGSAFEAEANCTFKTKAGEASIAISMSQKKANIDDINNLIIPDEAQDQASFKWGTRLLTTYWFRLLTVLAVNGSFPEERWGFYNRGGFVFSYDPSTNKLRSIRDVDFHAILFHFISSSVDGILNNDKWINELDLTMDQLYNNKKVIHSLLVADLGNSDVPNMLLSETELRRFLNGTDKNINREPGGVLSPKNTNRWNILKLRELPSPGKPQRFVPMEDSWEEYQSDMGELGTREAHVYRQYTCSVPRLKDTGKIILLVLVADLVFLQVAWKLLNLVAETLVARQVPATAMVCAGCLGADNGRETPVEMQNLIPERQA